MSAAPLAAAALFTFATSLAVAGNVVEELAERSEFSTLVTAVTAAGLAETLAEADDVTIFAPDNAAFARIDEADLAALLADKDALTNLLLYHVAPGKLRARDLDSGPLDTLLEGAPVEINARHFGWWYSRIYVDEARVRRANIGASNGVIHRINRVLDPGYKPTPTILEIAAGNPDFSILASLVEQAGFDRVLGSEYSSFTVFAPSNAAFEALGQETLDAVQADRGLFRDILRNHLAYRSLSSSDLAEAGEVRTLARFDLEIAEDEASPTGLSIDGKAIAAADIAASNGVVHVVSEVLLPPTPQSLVDVAVARDDLSTFVTAVTAAELAETFAPTDRWPAYTIFAPNNTAFDALPDGALESLLADPTGALADVLKLHVVRGKFEAAHLHDGQVLKALSGQRLQVSISDSREVRINNALVAETDLNAENGVLHVLNDVIAPDAFTVADFVKEKRYLSTLEAALEAANLTGALDDADGELTLFAPIDTAFRRLPAGTVESLLEDPEGDLTQILLYHVLGERLSAEELTETGTATTLQGSEVDISTTTYRFWGWRYHITRINDARVLSTDIQTDNGVVHLIYGVLIPEPSEAELE